MTQGLQERFKPGLQFVLPRQRCAHRSPPTESSQTENPRKTEPFLKPAKVVVAMKSDQAPSSESSKRIQEHVRKMLRELCEHQRFKVVTESYGIIQARRA
jgi:hypothetical protein